MRARHARAVKDSLYDLRSRLGVDVYLRATRGKCKGGWDENYVEVWACLPEGDARLSSAYARGEDTGLGGLLSNPEGVTGAVVEAHRTLDDLDREVSQGSLQYALAARAAAADAKHEEDES